MIAFSTIMDGIEYGGKNLLTTSGAAATTVVGHRYGDDARALAAEIAGGVKNVGLVYIDVTGVSRRAVLKSVAKGMVIGRVSGGGEVVVGGGDGGHLSDEEYRRIVAGGHGGPAPAAVKGSDGPLKIGGGPGYASHSSAAAAATAATATAPPSYTSRPAGAAADAPGEKYY